MELVRLANRDAMRRVVFILALLVSLSAAWFLGYEYGRMDSVLTCLKICPRAVALKETP